MPDEAELDQLAVGLALCGCEDRSERRGGSGRWRRARERLGLELWLVSAAGFAFCALAAPGIVGTAINWLASQ